MKKITLLFLTIISIIFISCSKNNDESNNGDSLSDGEAQLSVNGNEFVSQNTDISAVLVNEMMSLQFANLQSDEVVQVTFRNPAIATFDLSITGENYNAGSYVVSNVQYSSLYGEGTGEIIVTSYNTANKTISGNFEFEAYNLSDESLTINGIFQNVNYVIETNTTLGNSLNAKIDGMPLIPTSVASAEQTSQGYTYYGIVGTNENSSKAIALFISSEITVGTHKLSSIGYPGGAVGQYLKGVGGITPPSIYTSLDGTITITSYDPVEKTMQGIFVFTAGDPFGQGTTTYSISQGEFTLDL
ncbi:MAG: DUF6252 family protein [Flavobacteriaceae bacterium]